MWSDGYSKGIKCGIKAFNRIMVKTKTTLNSIQTFIINSCGKFDFKFFNLFKKGILRIKFYNLLFGFYFLLLLSTIRVKVINLNPALFLF